MRIIANESVFNSDPPKLFHREHEIEEVFNRLNTFAKSDNDVFVRFAVVGSPGVGKTTLVRWVYRQVLGRYQDRIRVVHVYGHLNRTLSSVIRSISSELSLAIPSRGLSRDEMMNILASRLRERDEKVVLVVDDAFNLAGGRDPPLTYLIRLAANVDDLGGYRIALIVISYDDSFLHTLDRSTRGIFGNDIIRLNPYTPEQMFDIVWDRAERGLFPGTYSEEVVEMVADVAGYREGDPESGDARLGINLLYNAARRAESEGAPSIEPEHVREANQEVLRGRQRDALMGLPLHAKLILLGIIRALRSGNKSYVKMGDVEDHYKMVCEQFGVRPRAHTQVWEYVKLLERDGIIETKLSGKGMRGRTTLISINRIPLRILEQEVSRLVSQDLGIVRV